MIQSPSTTPVWDPKSGPSAPIADDSTAATGTLAGGLSARWTARLVVGGLTALLMLVAAGSGESGPRRPTDDAEVVGRLPSERRDPRLLAAQRAKRDDDPRSAAALAREHLRLATSTGDARHLGLAAAALAPWSAAEAPPIELMLVRARLLQSRHDFVGARLELSRLLTRAPREPEGWMLRATVSAVTADFIAARESCRRLEGLTLPLLVTACISAVDGLTGHAAEATAELKRAVDANAEAPAEVRAWALVTLAELAQRRGQDREALDWFRQARRLAPHDGYAAVGEADAALDLGEARTAVDALAGRPEDDATLLRRALAARALGVDDGSAARLRERLAAQRLRGETLHAREAARFALSVDGDATAAAPLAVKNFEVQREPADVRLLLEVARELRDARLAEPALRWLAHSHCEDPKLTALARALGAAPVKGEP